MSQIAASWAGQEPKHVRIPLPDIRSALLFLLSHEHVIAVIGKKVLVYELLNFRLIHSLECHSPVISLDVYKDALVTGSEDHIIRIWDLISGECIHILAKDAYFLSIVKPELVEVEEDGTFAEEKWSRMPLLVTSSPYDSILRIWKLPGLSESGNKADVNVSKRV